MFTVKSTWVARRSQLRRQIRMLFTQWLPAYRAVPGLIQVSQQPTTPMASWECSAPYRQVTLAPGQRRYVTTALISKTLYFLVTLLMARLPNADLAPVSFLIKAGTTT